MPASTQLSPMSSANRSGAAPWSGADLLSVVVPTLNEEPALPITLACAARASHAELIVVDGGSTDRTRAIAARSGATVVECAPGRATQMNAGAAAATGDLLLFLHADTVLPVGYDAEIRRILDDRAVAAGAFRFRIAGRRLSFRLIERAVNLRSRWLSLPYGDQAIFMRRESLNAAGGFPEIAVMEDFALIRQLRKHGAICLARSTAETSGRRWDHEGPWRTSLRNQLAIAGFLCRVSPQRIARLLGRGLASEACHGSAVGSDQHPIQASSDGPHDLDRRTSTTKVAVGQPSCPSIANSIDLRMRPGATP